MTRVFLVVTVTASSILENGDGIQYGVVVGSSGRGKERDVGTYAAQYYVLEMVLTVTTTHPRGRTGRGTRRLTIDSHCSKEHALV